MKVAIVDFRFQKGHRTFNGMVVKAVKKLVDDEFIFIDNGENYRDCEDFYEHQRLIKNRNINRISSFKNRFISYKYMKDQYKIVQKEGCEKIVCLAFDLITFGFFGKKYFKKDIYLWHHAESDELCSGVKRKIFKRYMNKVKHIVHTPFIKEFLVNFGVDEKRIFVCPWMKTADSEINHNPEKNFFIAPSGSNDEGFCTLLAEYERKTEFFKNNGINLIIKSSTVDFDNGYLSFYNKYLTAEEYDDIFFKSSAVVMPFPKSFRMRESGTIIDALSQGKALVASDIPIVRYYSGKSADAGEKAVKIFTSPEELGNTLLKCESCSYPNTAKLISDEHGQGALTKALKEVIK